MSRISEKKLDIVNRVLIDCDFLFQESRFGPFQVRMSSDLFKMLIGQYCEEFAQTVQERLESIHDDGGLYEDGGRALRRFMRDDNLLSDTLIVEELELPEEMT